MGVILPFSGDDGLGSHRHPMFCAAPWASPSPLVISITRERKDYGWGMFRAAEPVIKPQSTDIKLARIGP